MSFIKNFIYLIFMLIIVNSCAEEIIFEDKYPNKNYLEISFCSFINNSTVSSLSENLNDLNKLNDSYLDEKVLTTFYLDPLFETETYDFIWFDMFSSKLLYLEYENLFKKIKKYINWNNDFSEKVDCIGNDKQLFYKAYENNDTLDFSEKFKKNVSFCKFLPNVNLFDLEQFLENDFSSSSQLNILISESEIENFDFVLDENHYEVKDYQTAASQIGFLASCNEEISDSFLNGLKFDVYPIYN
tara:strand:+ start:136 stop:864 length:729 start_codon:yes stop_codon:yes gene_type:complete